MIVGVVVLALFPLSNLRHRFGIFLLFLAWCLGQGFFLGEEHLFSLSLLLLALELPLHTAFESA